MSQTIRPIRHIDDKYAAVLMPPEHQPTCNSNLVPGMYCNCTSGDPRVVIIKTENGEILRDDEPLILFRAKDWLARRVLDFYRELCRINKCALDHVVRVDQRIRQFEQFAADHPERMKVPD